MGSDIVQYGDAAMYDAQPMLKGEEGARVTPRVFLLSATPDPLGNLAADMRMYRGDPVYNLDEITDEQRTWAWEELSKTALNTPLEGVQVKFMIEAVTRAWTHQAVRQRVGAYYVQESLRFAVKKGIAQECALPPSIMAVKPDDPRSDPASTIWHQTIQTIEKAYEQLVNAGIPAEDARGLLPHCVTTRMIYVTNLRALFNEAGKRMCTQAQFEWRAVFIGIIKAMREYDSRYHIDSYESEMGLDSPDKWQWELIASPKPKTFAPICYKTGKCEFMSQLDRGCSIRDRVEAFHVEGVTPDRWGEDQTLATVHDGYAMTRQLQGIKPEEWMSNPLAGITDETNRPK